MRYSSSEHVNIQLEHFFPKFFHDYRWTIAEPSLAMDRRHGIRITIAIDGHPGTLMNRSGDQHAFIRRNFY